MKPINRIDRNQFSRTAVPISALIWRKALMGLLAALPLIIGSGGLETLKAANGSLEDLAKVTIPACLLPPPDRTDRTWVQSVKMYNQGVEAVRQKNYDRAIGEFNAAIKLYPTNTMAHMELGKAYNTQEHHDRAIEEYSYVLKLMPNCFQALNSRCWARAIAGDLESALTDCNNALRVYPGLSAIFDSRGFVFLKMGNFDKAIADYDAALRIDLNHATSLYGRGKAKLMKGDEPGGTFDIMTAEKIMPDVAEKMARYGIK
jgi:tetratricopeptide (TPR) repeat protein